MPAYDVIVTLVATQTVKLRIDAPDTDEACDRAQEMAMPHYQWEWDENETYSSAQLAPSPPEDTP